MKKLITRACGHEEVVAIYGPYNTRDRQLEREAEKVCSQCYREQKKAEQNKLVEEIENLFQLPPLTGTEKQIAWARQLRAERARAIIDFLKERGITPEECANHDPAKVPILQALHNPSAAKFIDARTQTDLRNWTAAMNS